MSQKAKRMTVTALSAMILALATAALHAGDADLSGEWQLSVQTPSGTSTPTMTLEQEGTEVSGVYQSEFGDNPIAGSVDGDAFELTFNIQGPTGNLEITVDGTVENDSMSGDVHLGDLGSGPFTGERQ